MKNYLFTAIAALTITTSLTTSAAAAPIAPSQPIDYSKDSRYIYVKTPYRLTINDNHFAVVKKAQALIIAQLQELSEKNPRNNLDQNLSQKLSTVFIQNSEAYEAEITKLLEITSNLYSTSPTYQMTLGDLYPSGILLFAGFELSGGFGITAGGSITLGVVIVPQWVTVIEKDTHKVVMNTIEYDAHLVGFPTINAGPGIGGGANHRVGAGLIFGPLNKASDFSGVLYGASGSMEAGFGNNIKFQFLKRNLSLNAADNAVVSVAVETGVTAKTEFHANLAWVDAGQKVIDMLNALENKVASYFTPPSQPSKPDNTTGSKAQ